MIGKEGRRRKNQLFTVEMYNGAKHNVKATRDLFKGNKWDVLQRASQSLDFNKRKACYSVTEGTTSKEKTTFGVHGH